MAYVNAKGNTVLLKGDRIILQEDHCHCWYSFHKGEEAEIVCADKDGDNYYAIASPDGKKRVDGVILGGLADGSIIVTHHADTKGIEKIKESRNKAAGSLASEILLCIARHKEKL